jgi:hypothetical protein
MKRILYIAILLLSLTSCTEEIEIELDSTFTRLVVFGEITTDTTKHTIELRRSADYFFNLPAEGISGAIVEISSEDRSLLLGENPDHPGTYETPADFYGEPGKTYNLSISGIDINEDGITENYTASSYMPVINPIDSITLKYTANSFFSGWEIQVWTYDPAEIKNFYVFKARVNKKLVTDTLTELVVQNDDLFNGNYTYGITSQFLLESKEDEKLFPGDTVTFEANSITEDYYNFLVEAQSESFGQTPLFSGPPANISSNISNGALGFFTAYSITRSSKIVPEIMPENP